MAETYLDILLKGLNQATGTVPLGLNFLSPNNDSVIENIKDDIGEAVVNNNPSIAAYDTTASLISKFINDLGITDRYIPTSDQATDNIANDNNNKTYGGGGSSSPANSNSGIGSLNTSISKPNAPGGTSYGMSPGERRAKYGS